MQANDSVIVINAGSSSIKFSMYSGPALDLTMRGKIENLYSGVARFIDERRLQRAWLLISSPSGPSIAEVARTCGYASKARLNRAFVERLNATPDAIRSVTGETREQLHELAGLEIISSWDRRAGRAALTEHALID